MSEQVVRRYFTEMAIYPEQLPIESVKDCFVVLADDHDAAIDALHAEAEALRAENTRLSQQLAQSDSALRESRANDMANVRTLENMWERHDALRQELEAARGLLRKWLDTDLGVSSPAINRLKCSTDYLLATTPAPEVQAETLDDRLKQAGMLSVAELLKGAPLDAFVKHAGVHDLATLLQWAEMRRGECLKAMALYDLGEKDKGDDLYEWTVAHCAVFTELHVNLRAALAEQGERQEAVAWTVAYPPEYKPFMHHLSFGSESEAARYAQQKTPKAMGCVVVALYTTPQPDPDVRALVEALERASKTLAELNDLPSMRADIDAAIAAHRQAQRKGEQP